VSTTNEQVTPGDRDERAWFYEELQPLGLAPLWAVLKGLVPPHPVSSAVSHKWAWADTFPRLLRAGELITAEEAERRVLVLENPGLSGKSQVTDTLYGGLQLILPGEVARAHRHTQSALRFVLQGTGAYTAIDGEKVSMQRGDFIITPHWTWHDHGHDGSEPVVWLDGLDVPLVTFLRAGFREEHENKSQEVTSRVPSESAAPFGAGHVPLEFCAEGRPISRVFSYPYSRAREALERLSRSNEPDPHLGICMTYVDPTTGGWAMPTIGTVLRYFPRGLKTLPYRSTDSTVLVGLEGRATVRVGEQTFSLEPNDIVAVPGWTAWSVAAAEDTILFSYSDRPVHEKLGLLREWRG